MKGEMTRQEIQSSLNLSDRVNLRDSYLQPAIEQGLVAMKFPNKPNHPKQRYYLTSNIERNGNKNKKQKMIFRCFLPSVLMKQVRKSPLM